jgi:signal peptidase II
MFFLLLIDQITKFLQFSFKIITDGFVYLSVAENRGSAFSLFSNISWYNELIIFLSIVLFIFGVWYLFKHNLKKYEIIIFILFGAGLLGNLIDRILFDYVRDFIGVTYFAIFNIADVYLTLAALILIYYEIRNSKN